MTAAPLPERALTYAARGWAVLPLWWPRGRRCACGRPDCANVGKHPLGSLVPHGLDQATADQVLIRRWWAACPEANLGLVTGAVRGLVVDDVDGEEGVASLRSLVDRHARFQAAWARTGSGGWHGYLDHPGQEVPNSAGRLGPKLDVRGDGGYVVAPPSLHASGRRYRWLHGLPDQLPAVPGWMVELLLPPPPAPPRPIRLAQVGLKPYVLAAIEGEAREVAAAPAGQRNDRLNLAAYRLGQLVGAGLVWEASVTEVLRLAAQAAGLGEREALATIRSGLRAGVRHPRDVAP